MRVADIVEFESNRTDVHWSLFTNFMSGLLGNTNALWSQQLIALLPSAREPSSRSGGSFRIRRFEMSKNVTDPASPRVAVEPAALESGDQRVGRE